jgi:hypothetical protein
MMAINIDELLPHIRHLVPKLEEAQNAVNAETDERTRKDLIESYRPRWVALREDMERLSHGKCWYSECKNPGTDDDVDHFRPKNAVAVEKNEARHDGYYWLAFIWKNFRLSSHRSNRLRKNPETGETGGKGDRFPLLDPKKRLRTPTSSQADLDNEGPLLLDPTKPRDVTVITFTAKGVVAIAPSFETNKDEVKRFEATRKCYHLDWPEFRDERVQLYNLIEQRVLRADQVAPPRATSGMTRSEEFDLIVFQLRRLMDRDQAYSSAARAYISAFRSCWWVDAYVLLIQSPGSAQGGGTTSGSPSN